MVSLLWEAPCAILFSKFFHRILRPLVNLSIIVSIILRAIPLFRTDRGLPASVVVKLLVKKSNEEMMAKAFVGVAINVNPGTDS